MANNLYLEKEQEELLFSLVEAARSVRREQRQKFYASQELGKQLAVVQHLGLPGGSIDAYIGDIEILGRLLLLNVSHEEFGLCFDVAPRGFQYYEQLKNLSGQSPKRVEDSLRNYFDTLRFQKMYSQAYQKWSEAESLLWGSDSQQQLTTIGHICREAMQEFVASCVECFNPPGVDPDKAHTISRLKAVLNHCTQKFGKTEQSFLDALITYWDEVSELVQRQEHGAQKEGQQLIWEDGRRVVFQTAVVMFEVDRALSRSQTS